MLVFAGLSIHTFHGNFFVRSTDLLSLPNVNPDAGFAVQMSIEENLNDMQVVSFQAALLYTSSKGTHTWCGIFFLSAAFFLKAFLLCFPQEKEGSVSTPCVCLLSIPCLIYLQGPTCRPWLVCWPVWVCIPKWLSIMKNRCCHKARWSYEWIVAAAKIQIQLDTNVLFMCKIMVKKLDVHSKQMLRCIPRHCSIINYKRFFI